MLKRCILIDRECKIEVFNWSDWINLNDNLKIFCILAKNYLNYLSFQNMNIAERLQREAEKKRI